MGVTIKQSTSIWRSLWNNANPTRFLKIADRLIPVLTGSMVLFLIAGLYLVLSSPEDYQQGITVRIMFIHVPAAWIAMMCYFMMSLSALGALVWRHPLAGASIRVAAPIGAAFTFLALITGSLWGKPMWGTWWVWDGRLTSMLVLLVIYMGLIALSRAIEDSAIAARALGVITLIGFINIPIIKFSVDWWETLHQKASISSIERIFNPAMDAAFLYPLLTIAVAYCLLFFVLYLISMQNEILRRRIRFMRMMTAHETKRKA